MTNIVYIDFETRSEVDLRKTGAWAYAEDPSTSILCFCIAINDHHVETFVLNGEQIDCPTILNHAIDRDDVMFEAHNAFFEQSIWYNICHKRFGWKDIPVEKWACSASFASAAAIPRSLQFAGEAMDLDIQKDTEGRSIMLQLARPRKPSKANPNKFWTPDVVPEKFARLYEYCADDVRTERELSKKLRPLNKIERQVWLLDQKINRRGVRVDVPAIESIIKEIDEYTDGLSSAFRAITDNQVETPRQITRFVKWLGEQGVIVDSVNKASVEQLLKQEDLPDKVRKALELRQELSKSSTAKYQAMLNAVSKDGRIRDILVYHGATTGRWAGTKVQFQNIPRGVVKDTDKAIEILLEYGIYELTYEYPDIPPMTVISSCIRGMIIPDEGNDFVVADYSAIEARVIAWLAGQTDLVDAFENGEDVYCNEASKIYNKDVNKSDHPYERQVGKTCILAFGYQGGIRAMQTMSTGYGLSLEPAYDGLKDSFTEEESAAAKKLVDAYLNEGGELSEEEAYAADILKRRWRASNNKIVSFWYNVEEAAKSCLEVPNTVIRVNDYISFMYDGDFMYCRLPSKRVISYPSAKLEVQDTRFGKKAVITYKTNDTKGAFVRTGTYGGKLTENIVQGVARDLMAEAMLRCEEHGYKVVLSVHDELITEVPEGFGSVEELETIMSTLPSWAEGCPVTAEGWRGKRYKK